MAHGAAGSFASRCGAPSRPTSRSSSPKRRAGSFRQGTVAIGVPAGVLPATLTFGGTRGCPCLLAENRLVKTHVRVLVIGGGVVGREYALSPDQEGLEGRRADRAHGTDRRLDLACRRPAAAVQHELHGRPAAQVLGRSVQAPAGRDRAGRELPRDRQPAPCDLQGAHGRVPEVLRHGQHDRRALRGHHTEARQGAVAAGRARRQRRYARDHRRALPPGRRSHRTRRPHHGAAQGRAQRGRRDLRAHRGAGDRAHRLPASGWCTPPRARSRAEHLVFATGNYARADRRACSGSTCRRSRSSTSTSSTTNHRS